MTTSEEVDTIVKGLRSGASVYLLKDEVSVDTFVAAIKRVAQGEHYMQPEVLAILLAQKGKE